MSKIKYFTAGTSKFLLSLVGLFILTIGVLAGVVLTQNTNNSQDTRSLAAGGIGDSCGVVDGKDYGSCAKASKMDVRCIDSICDEIGGHLTCPKNTISNGSCESCSCSGCSFYWDTIWKDGQDKVVRRCNRPAYDNVPICCTPITPPCPATDPTNLTITSTSADGRSVRVNWTPGNKGANQLFRMGTSLDEVNTGCYNTTGQEPCIATYNYPTYVTPAPWIKPIQMYYFSKSQNKCGDDIHTNSFYTEIPTCNANLTQYVGDSTGVCYTSSAECTKYNQTSQTVSGLQPGNWYYARVVNFNTSACYADVSQNYYVPAARTPTPLPLGSIGDKVWIDTNKNGLQDAGEPGKSNVKVILTSGTGIQVTAVTDANGNYRFSNLKPGNYSLKFTLPVGYKFTAVNVGSDFYDSDADVNGYIGNINVTVGEYWNWMDAGLVAITATITPPKVSLTPTKTPTRTPTPGVVVCKNCQYQADLFWGPVIKSFKGGIRYGNSRRIKNINLHPPYFTGYPGCPLTAVSKIVPTIPVLSKTCSDPIAKGYLKGTIAKYDKAPNGYLKGTITNSSSGCYYDVGMASYKANGSDLEIQNLYSYMTKRISPKQTLTFYVRSPMIVDSNSCHASFVPR